MTNIFHMIILILMMTLSVRKMVINYFFEFEINQSVNLSDYHQHTSRSKFDSETLHYKAR